MNRQEIFELIEAERAAQDKLWPRDVAVNPNRAQYKFYAPHLYLLEEKLARIRSIWYGSEKEKLRAELIKVATIAVRALEEVE